MQRFNYPKSSRSLLATFILFAMFYLSGGVSAQDAPTLSLSLANMSAQPGATARSPKAELNSASSPSFGNAFVVDFVPGSQGVAGINFDVVFDDVDALKIVSCGAGVGDTHIAQCKQVGPKRLRVLIFSAPVTKLNAVEALKFEISGADTHPKIDRESVAVSDLSGAVIQANVM